LCIGYGSYIFQYVERFFCPPVPYLKVEMRSPGAAAVAAEGYLLSPFNR
jgi:hypothetical protein